MKRVELLGTGFSNEGKWNVHCEEFVRVARRIYLLESSSFEGTSFGPGRENVRQ